MGASTITQQLVRNTILADEMNDISFKRKVREMYLSVKLEEQYSKDEILQKILYGDSGENWAALSGKNENFQRVLLERAERERKQ